MLRALGAETSTTPLPLFQLFQRTRFVTGLSNYHREAEMSTEL